LVTAFFKFIPTAISHLEGCGFLFERGIYASNDGQTTNMEIPLFLS
jgi:hypothetical protein